MKNYAFIFARGGSRGLPRKNILPLNGKPLIEYSIESALATEEIQQVFVSTDDAEIAEIAISVGAIVIDRPEELATDSSPEWFSWRHAINWVVERYGEFDVFVSLPATSPLRAVEDVQGALLKLNSSEADICISVTPSNRNPYFNMVKYNDRGLCELVNSTKGGVYRRQDAPVVYDITTVVYAAAPEFILKEQSIFGGRVTSIEVPKERAVDIDDIYDFRFAEALLQASR